MFDEWTRCQTNNAKETEPPDCWPISEGGPEGAPMSHPLFRKLTWNLRIDRWKTIFLYNPVVLGFHVNL